jgi:hypothetical protein
VWHLRASGRFGLNAPLQRPEWRLNFAGQGIMIVGIGTTALTTAWWDWVIDAVVTVDNSSGGGRANLTGCVMPQGINNADPKDPTRGPVSLVATAPGFVWGSGYPPAMYLETRFGGASTGDQFLCHMSVLDAANAWGEP